MLNRYATKFKIFSTYYDIILFSLLARPAVNSAFERYFLPKEKHATRRVKAEVGKRFLASPKRRRSKAPSFYLTFLFSLLARPAVNSAFERYFSPKEKHATRRVKAELGKRFLASPKRRCSKAPSFYLTFLFSLLARPAVNSAFERYFPPKEKHATRRAFLLVEVSGFEPLASSLRTRRSTN